MIKIKLKFYARSTDNLKTVTIDEMRKKVCSSKATMNREVARVPQL